MWALLCQTVRYSWSLLRAGRGWVGKCLEDAGGVVSVSVLLVIYILWVYCMERKKKSCIKFSNVFVKGCLNKFRKLIPLCVKCCTIIPSFVKCWPFIYFVSFLDVSLWNYRGKNCAVSPLNIHIFYHAKQQRKNTFDLYITLYIMVAVLLVRYSNIPILWP